MIYPNRSRALITAGLVLAAAVLDPAAGVSQTGPRLYDTGRLDTLKPIPARPGPAVPNPAPVIGAPAGLGRRQFVLNDLVVDGAASIPPGKIAATWQAYRGRTIDEKQLYAIAQAIGTVYANSDIALYSIFIPPQKFDGGPVHIRVVEGYVDAVAIEGNTNGADLSLLKNYAAKIVADRPLHRSVLAREVLLMSSIAGLTVGSKFEPLPGGAPGAVRLRLGVLRKTFQYGLDFTNQGASVLSRVQLGANVVANSVFREGDRTQLLFGMPIDINRYQYYGINHIEPIGDDGATVTINVGNLVTHAKGTLIGGNAVIASIQGSYPVILATKENLTVTADLDAIDSSNAVLGSTLSDERTRAARVGVSYAVQDESDAITGGTLTLSQGIDGLGARRGGPAFGGPSFTKITTRLVREQPLPWDFVARLRASAQYTPDHLPASEQLAYGGLDFGQGFETSALFGDEGIEAYGELAYKIPDTPIQPWLSGSEIFISADWARVYNIHTIYQYKNDSGSSAGIGVRTKLLGKVGVQLEVARVLQEPRSVGTHEGYRFVASLNGTF
jgi:hemolysin activation/secretion protein